MGWVVKSCISFLLKGCGFLAAFFGSKIQQRKELSMSELLHVVIKDHENSGYVWDDFFCRECLDKMVNSCTGLEIIKRSRLTPQYLSRLYPPLVNEPVCQECDLLFGR
jgi:hypothetical protein